MDWNTIIVALITGISVTGINELRKIFGRNHQRAEAAELRRSIAESDLQVADLEVKKIETTADGFALLIRKLEEARIEASNGRVDVNDLMNQLHRVEVDHKMTLRKVSYQLQLALATCRCEAQPMIKQLVESLEKKTDSGEY